MVCFFYLVGEFMDYGAAFFVVMGKIDYFFLGRVPNLKNTEKALF